MHKHWNVIFLKHLFKSRKCLPTMWPMKRKRNPLGNIIKYKALLYAGGH